MSDLTRGYLPERNVVWLISDEAVLVERTPIHDRLAADIHEARVRRAIIENQRRELIDRILLDPTANWIGEPRSHRRKRMSIQKRILIYGLCVAAIVAAGLWALSRQAKAAEWTRSAKAAEWTRSASGLTVQTPTYPPAPPTTTCLGLSAGAASNGCHPPLTAPVTGPVCSGAANATSTQVPCSITLAPSPMVTPSPPATPPTVTDSQTKSLPVTGLPTDLLLLGGATLLGLGVVTLVLSREHRRLRIKQ